ncbi:MAG: bifunctional oligoribonuclease/PAP phosphatase NrnA [Eubacteriales bacterium]|nr:bifunctional oligoribonuclease/PAP phosphatase NrnA [Eubacteriales bacterium]
MKNQRQKFNQMIRAAETICVLGHVNPDGDCIGSTLGVYNYIKAIDPSKKVGVYHDNPSEKFDYLNGFDSIIHDNAVEKSYDLCVICDCAEKGRIPQKYHKYLDNAKETFLIDHHMTNEGFCENAVIIPDISSTAEVLFDLIDEELFNVEIAKCIYTGIIHDTGVFKYNSTTERTMQIAGKCMSYGFDFGKIIDDSFFAMNLLQKKLLGYVLGKIESAADGQIVYAKLTNKEMKEYGITDKKYLDGFIDNIRTTSGAVCGMFFYQMPDGNYKGSLRSSTDKVNVAAIAKEFKGGGHLRASGCTVEGNIEEGIAKILAMVEDQLRNE